MALPHLALFVFLHTPFTNKHTHCEHQVNIDDYSGSRDSSGVIQCPTSSWYFAVLPLPGDLIKVFSFTVGHKVEQTRQQIQGQLSDLSHSL